ncbi:MAG: serine/threonine-protein kinase [Polyangiaceae bacterium]
MKTCGSCHRLFDDAGFCPIDGAKLEEINLESLPSSPDDKRVGQVVCDRYAIFRVVADGGMGRVYQAFDKKEGRNVALKILHLEVAQDPVSVERFKREYDVSRSLLHPNIVEVHAFERTDDGSFALAMEYLEGEELRMLLKREKTMRPERVIRMVSQVAVALAAAHERKQVHRDLKPDNLFLCHTPEGDVTKILDFGSVRDNSENAKKLTVMGTTIGSPFYMAPEQAQGLAELDHRADVWSIAAIIYECLAGTVPFVGTTGPAILLAILTQDPAPISQTGKAHEVPETLDEVIEVALAKDPNIRYGSIGALADALGKAYGLEGGHQAWAHMAESTLAEAIQARLPEKLEAHRAAQAAKPDLGAMDAAFSKTKAADDLPADYVVMGLPPERPKWFWPAIGGGAVLLLVVVAAIAFR